MKTKTQKLQLRRPVTKVLGLIPEKSREVLARRFGIGYEKPETLESIGRRYGITRERVRQIQEFGLSKLVAGQAQEIMSPVFAGVEAWMKGKGGVVGGKDLFEGLARTSEKPHLAFALRLMPTILLREETEDLAARYGATTELIDGADACLLRVHEELTKRKSPLPFAELLLLTKAVAGKFGGDSLDYLLTLSKRIGQGPFGEYGLLEWPQIFPKGVRDKAFLVFEKEKKPLHFKELTKLIDVYFGGKKLAFRANPQTVHNELIKDPRFVLIGRGLYGLADWGYNPGTVKDVLLQILREGGHPMNKEEILTLISERRFVRPNTVLLNLQNKNYFKRVEGGKYYVA